MRPVHRAQLAAAIARFEADIRQLGQVARRQQRDRLMATLDPPSAKSAAKARTRTPAAAAPRKQPATRAPRRPEEPRAQPAAPRRTRKPRAAAGARGEAIAAEPAITTPASSMPAGAEASTTSTPSPSPAGDRDRELASSDRAREPAAKEGTRGEPGAAAGGGKRVKWTREAIIDELAKWILSGTAIDASFVKRHGAPGLVPATLRIFGRFDAAMNVASLHVSKLYPDGAPAR